MANNGPSTNLLQQALLTLLQGRSPSPLAPVPTGPQTPPGGFMPFPMGPPPEPAPVAPPPALDTALIEQLTGPRPVAPVEQPVSLLQKVALALQGFGAGTQGQGPQFLANLQEQRERPQREFRAANEEYRQRRAGAVEFAERRREREQAATQAQADAQAEREFRQWVQRTGVQDQMALEQMRQAFDLEKLRQTERIADEKLERQQKALDERQVRAFQFKLMNEEDAPSHIAKQIAEFLITGKPMTPAAEKWRSLRAQKAQAQLGRLSGGGSGSGGGLGVNDKAAKAWQTFEAIKQQVIAAEERGDTPGAEQLRRKMISVHNSLASRFPGVFELGYGDREGKWPYVQPRQGAQPQGAPAPGGRRLNMAPADQTYFDLRGGGPSVGPGAQQTQQTQPTKTATMAQIRAAAAEAGISEAEAVQQFKDAGYSIQP